MFAESFVLSLAIKTNYLRDACLTFVQNLPPQLVGKLPSLESNFHPIMNTSLAFTELMKGTLNFGFMVPVVLVNTVVIFAVLTFAMSLYRSEKVLSRN